MRILRQVVGVQSIFLLQYLSEDLPHHFFRLFSTRFDVFRAYSVVVTRLSGAMTHMKKTLFTLLYPRSTGMVFPVYTAGDSA